MKAYIGIDLGGTAIKGGAYTKDGELKCSMEVPTGVERGFEAIAEDIAKMVFAMSDCLKNGKEGAHLTSVGSYGLKGTSLAKPENIASVGVGMPGISNGEAGHILFCTNLHWIDVPLGERLRAYTGLPVFVDNDATVAGYAESVFGVTKGAKNSVFLTLGTGIGGGIIVNHHIYSGSHGGGSEIGHMMIGENFYDCTCGRNGCFETFASATALVKYGTHRLGMGMEESTLRAYAERGELTAKAIFDEAKAGDRIANEAVNRLVKYLAKGILNVYDILDPDVVALGGGLSKAGDFLLEKVREEVKQHTLVKLLTYGEIHLAKLGNSAGMLGAAMLGLNYLGEEA